MEFLLRDDAPFSQEQWERIDDTVIRTARQTLIGRRFIHIYGPLGAGVDSVMTESFDNGGEANAGFAGDEETAAVKVSQRRHWELPMIYKDFYILWRDLENAKQFRLPLDYSAVASAASICAKQEDNLIFNGNKSLGYEGLLTAKGIQRIAKSDWGEDSNAFNDVVSGIEALVGKGFTGEFTLVVSPDLYTKMQRIQPQLGILELDRIKSLVDGKIYQTTAVGQDRAILLSSEFRNLDLAVGQDLITAYLGPEKLNHGLRVLETVLLRIKNPEAIVVFETKK
jgi:uncharacterized linocin/CFP29 family protein